MSRSQPNSNGHAESEPVKFVVCALYKFVSLDDYQQLREPLLHTMKSADVHGTLLLASEGINGTIAGPRRGIDQVLAWLNRDHRLTPLDTKESFVDAMPFRHTRVKLKKEIVTLGISDLDPRTTVGTYIEPKEWNQLIQDPDVVLIDTRNDYEIQAGTFQGAMNPRTETFREFPAFVQNNLNKKVHKKVAMCCTGGIRCEKSTALLKQQGFDEVYHLKGGILNYLAQVSEQDSLWQGECFVFDDRVTVNHQLEKGSYDQCHACRLPISEADKASDRFQPGVSCPHCYDRLTEQQKQRFAEREKQMRLARSRGESHLGEEVGETIKQRRLRKEQRRQQLRKKQHIKSNT